MLYRAAVVFVACCSPDTTCVYMHSFLAREVLYCHKKIYRTVQYSILCTVCCYMLSYCILYNSQELRIIVSYLLYNRTTLLRCYDATMLQCYNATMLLCYYATMLQCYNATMLQYYNSQCSMHSTPSS
jgi:hypothetical protein